MGSSGWRGGPNASVNHSLNGFVDAVGVVTDQVPIDRKSSLGLEVNEFAELICVGRPAGAGERHHGPFREWLEPQIGRAGRIEKAERIEDLAVPQALEAIAGADIGGLGGLVPMSVHHQHRRLLEGRREKDRRMRVVMLYLNDLQQLLVDAEVPHQSPSKPHGHGDDEGGQIWAGAWRNHIEAGRKPPHQRPEHVAPERLHLPRRRDDIDIVDA